MDPGEIAGWPRFGPGPAASVGESAKTSCTVSLKVPDAREPRGERDVGHRQRGGLDEQPGGLRALGAGERERPGAEFGEQLPLDLPDAVAELPGEAR